MKKITFLADGLYISKIGEVQSHGAVTSIGLRTGEVLQVKSNSVSKIEEFNYVDIQQTP
jgi:hypothetical protein